MGNRYEKRGVSSSKEEVHAAIKGLDRGLMPNAFCKILPDIAGGDPAFCNIMHADTAGTKTSLAYIYWKETGDLDVWKGIAEDAIVMNLDDMACAGATGPFLLSSTVGRNKKLIPGEVISALIRHTYDFAVKMSNYGVDIFPSGGETADVGDIVRTIDVGYTAFTRLPRNQVIDIDIREGDVIVGFSSYGKSIYEDSYNGGIGSNGLTSARHDLLSSLYKVKYPESYDPTVPFDVVYSGNKHLYEPISIGQDSTPLGKLILSPTRTYLPLIKKCLPDLKPWISAWIHCTGGGQTKVMKFIPHPLKVVKNNMLEVPPLFQLIREHSGTSLREMYEVFNMGHRLEAYVRDRKVAGELVCIAQELGIEAQIIGEVIAAGHKSLEIRHGEETIEYTYPS